MERKIDIYDKTDIYLGEMKPVINELITLAKKYDLPTFVTVAVANNEKETKYMSDVVLASTEMTLFENRIANILFLLNGFIADAPEDIRNMYRELLYYLMPSIPDVKNMVDVRLRDEWISALYKAACHNTGLRYPTENVPE